MRAMILAAGKGSRLQPLTDTTPKPLIEVAGRPMIAFALKLVQEAGIHEVVINLHHLGGQIRTALGDGRAYGVHISYSVEDPILDTGGGIAQARELLAGERFVLLNSDVCIDIALASVIEFHQERGALATMVLRPDPDAARYGIIEVDRTQRIRRFLGKTAAGAPPPTADLTPLMYTGIIVFEPTVFRYFPPGIYSLTRDVFPRMLDAGEALFGYVHHGYWRILDTPHDLAAGRADLALRLPPEPSHG